jgi:hypothetical protein
MVDSSSGAYTHPISECQVRLGSGWNWDFSNRDLGGVEQGSFEERYLEGLAVGTSRKQISAP